ncbi:hypothetical protein [Rhizobium binxianense]
MSIFTPRPATYARHYQEPPQIVEAGGARTWITRGANFIIAITEAREGTVLSRTGHPDEYMIVLPPDVTADIIAGDEKRTVTGDSLIIVPPGGSTLTVAKAGTVLRVFSSRPDDLASVALNAAVYASGDSAATPLEDWPAPAEGFRLHVYRLADYGTPGGPLIQPRIFRSTNLMINAFLPWHSLRPADDMRPHWHDDFEQASVALEGRWMHHVRMPWNSNVTTWREDQHETVDSPSVTIIPETLIHATTNVGEGRAWLIDVFAPPRLDFAKAGIVLNGADYPMPVAKAGLEEDRDVPLAWRKKG